MTSANSNFAPRPALQLFSLAGKTALVTGGSRGLGLQMAFALGEAGAKVLISSRKEAELQAAVAQLQAAGISASYCAADASKPEEIARLGAHALQTLGQVDVLINNAGATWGAPAEDHPLEAWDKVLNLNVRSIFLLSQYIGKHDMLKRKAGRIINIASIAGLGGNAPEMRTLAYNTSKAAVINLTRTLAGEWGRSGINVNAICPGFFPSKMASGLMESMGLERVAARAPLNRIGDSEDLKGVTLLFASDAGKHITGQALAVDGGVSAVIGM